MWKGCASVEWGQRTTKPQLCCPILIENLRGELCELFTCRPCGSAGGFEYGEYTHRERKQDKQDRTKQGRKRSERTPQELQDCPRRLSLCRRVERVCRRWCSVGKEQGSEWDPRDPPDKANSSILEPCCCLHTHTHAAPVEAQRGIKSGTARATCTPVCPPDRTHTRAHT